MGSIAVSCGPTEVRGRIFVPGIAPSRDGNTPSADHGTPPWQVPFTSCEQPYKAPSKLAFACGFNFNWLWFSAISSPMAAKNEKSTGPAMGMRYSILFVIWVSPPMGATEYTGSGICTGPNVGFVGSLGTRVPSALVRLYMTLVGTNA